MSNDPFICTYILLIWFNVSVMFLYVQESQEKHIFPQWGTWYFSCSSVSFMQWLTLQSKNTSENQEPLCSHTRMSSLPSSLPPLPYSPLARETSRSGLNSISSPLVSVNVYTTARINCTCMTQERMTLMSPGVPTTTSRPICSGARRFTFPSHPLRGHSVESDGYSEVFDGEDAPSSLPSRLITLMNAPFTSTPADTSNKEVLYLTTLLLWGTLISHACRCLLTSLQSIPHHWSNLVPVRQGSHFLVLTAGLKPQKEEGAH